MKPLIFMLALISAAPLSATAQVGQTINRRSLYSGTLLRQLVRASQLAADRQQSIFRRSALAENETVRIRRHSTLSSTEQKNLDRLSAFAGDRLRSLEEMSEFRADQISRMQADYRSELLTGGNGPNRLAELAKKNSTMPRPQMQRILRASDAREWANQVKRRALAAGGYADLLRGRSLASNTQSRLIKSLSLGN